MDKLISIKDIIIPKGTVFSNVSGSSSHYFEDNYRACVGLDRDTSVDLVVSSENEEYFKVFMGKLGILEKK